MATILVIEDDETICTLVRKVVERGGHRVVEAEDGVHGLELFESEAPDLVVVDLFMPRKNGWETLREIHNRVPGVPFVIISSGGALELLRRGQTGTLAAVRGVVPHRVLRKPFSIRQLRETVEGLLVESAGPARRTG